MGTVKLVETRATSFRKFRPSSIRKGLKFLLNSISYNYDDLESELEDYRVKKASEGKTRKEKRRINLEKIRNEELDNEAETCSSNKKKDYEKHTKEDTKVECKNLPVTQTKSTSESNTSKPKMTKKKTEPEVTIATPKTLPPLITKTSAKNFSQKYKKNHLESLNTSSKKLPVFFGNDVNAAPNNLPASTKESEAEKDNSEKCVSKASPQLTNKIALKSLEPSNFKILLADAQSQNTTLKSEMRSTAC